MTHQEETTEHVDGALHEALGQLADQLADVHLDKTHTDTCLGVTENGDQFYLVACPHCALFIQIMCADTNCRIFRHAVHLSSGQQLPPHSNLETCERAIASGEYVGCGKPFQLVGEKAVVCDYI